MRNGSKHEDIHHTIFFFFSLKIILHAKRFHFEYIYIYKLTLLLYRNSDFPIIEGIFFITISDTNITFLHENFTSYFHPLRTYKSIRSIQKQPNYSKKKHSVRPQMNLEQTLTILTKRYPTNYSGWIWKEN